MISFNENLVKYIPLMELKKPVRFSNEGWVAQIGAPIY